jgi:hypothetical protein
MVFLVLAGELKLGIAFFGQCLFTLVKFIHYLQSMGTGIVAAF